MHPKQENKNRKTYIELLKKGEITLKQIATENLANYIRHETSYISIVSKFMQKYIHPPQFVAWISGSTGTGKSRTVQMIAEKLKFDLYDIEFKRHISKRGCFRTKEEILKLDNTYRFEECAILDNYSSHDEEEISFYHLLKLIDQKSVVNINGSKVFFCPKIIIITSLENVKSIKNNMSDDKFTQFLERINFRVNFKIFPEESVGIPTEREVLKVVTKVCDKFISMYKCFLLKNGFEDLVDNFECMKDA